MDFDDEIPEEPQESQLDALLGDFKADGTVDSEGEFSLDPFKALKKLGDFALPRPAAWVVLGVQAAVASGCESCKIELARRKVSFVLSPAPDIELQELVQATLAGDLSLPPNAACLSSLLRVVVARNWSLQLRKVTASKATGLSLVTDSLTWERADPNPDQDFLAIVVSRPSEPAARDEKRELIENAHAAPLELTLNNNRVDTFNRDHLNKLVGHGRELNLAVAASPSENGFALPADAPDALLAAGDKYEAVALMEGRSPKPQVHLNWLRFGVIIDREEISKGYDVEGHSYVLADDLETDLSGFGLQRSVLKDERRATGLRLLRDACSEALVNTRAQHRPLAASRQAVRSFTAQATGTVLGVACLWWALSGNTVVFSAGNRWLYLLMAFLRVIGFSAFFGVPMFLFSNFLVRTFLAPSTGLEHTLEDLELLEKRLVRIAGPSEN